MDNLGKKSEELQKMYGISNIEKKYKKLRVEYGIEWDRKLTDDQINQYFLMKQAKDIATIKGILIFFAVVAAISIICTLITTVNVGKFISALSHIRF